MLTERINFPRREKRLVSVGFPYDLQLRVQAHRVHRLGLFEGRHGPFVEARHYRVDSGQARLYRGADRQGLVAVFGPGPFRERDARRATDEEQQQRCRGRGGRMGADGHGGRDSWNPDEIGSRIEYCKSTLDRSKWLCRQTAHFFGSDGDGRTESRAFPSIPLVHRAPPSNER